MADQGRKLYASKRASESKAERRGVQMERPSSISPEAPDVPAKRLSRRREPVAPARDRARCALLLNTAHVGDG